MLFISDFRFVSSRSTGRREFGGRGVRKNTHFNKCRHIYVEENKSRGVRKHYNIIIILDRKKTSSCLRYSKPCLCGSLNHARTNHSDCLLNKQYSDASSD